MTRAMRPSFAHREIDYRNPQRLISSVSAGLAERIPHPLLRIDQRPYLLADYVLAWGEIARTTLRANGRQKPVFVTGSPLFEDTSPAQKVRFQRLPTILFADRRVGSDPKHIKTYKHIAEVCCDALGLKLVLKLHPRSRIDAVTLEGILRSGLSNEHLITVYQREDIQEFLDRSDILMTWFSTVAYHALSRSMPIILLGYHGRVFELELASSGAAVRVDQPESLEPVLRSLLGDKEVQQRVEQGMAQAVKEHLHRCDGRAGDRIANCVAEILADQ